MNFKTILAAVLLFLIVLGMVTYGYIIYTVNSNTQKKGDEIVNGHKTLVYSVLFIQLLQFVASGLILYKI